MILVVMVNLVDIGPVYFDESVRNGGAGESGGSVDAGESCG